MNKVNLNKETVNKPHNIDNYIISILMVLFLIIWGYYLSNNIVDKLWQKIIEIEYSKVWGKENYEIINKVNLDQIKNFVNQYKATQWNDVLQNNNNEPKTLTQDEILSIKQNAYIEWNENAKIMLVEYSDLECPFCIRQFQDWIIKKLHEKYWDKINSIFKNYRWVAHENSEIKALASMCAWELWWSKAYADFYNKIYENTQSLNWSTFGRDKLSPLAQELWLNIEQFETCINSNKYVDLYNQNTVEWQKFWIRWTPGTLIINSETGKYSLIDWALPIEKFEEAIDKLL